MCLYLENSEVEVKTTKKDKVVYKRLVLATDALIPNNNLDGKEFTGVINGEACFGKISLLSNGVFYCTDNKNLEGKDAYDKKGYKYSWIHAKDVESIVVDGEELITRILITPYRDFKVKLGETYESFLMKREDVVNEGIHSFDSIEDAKKDGDGVFVKCIIPKGSSYYEGTFSASKSFASNKLKYVEIVEE